MVSTLSSYLFKGHQKYIRYKLCPLMSWSSCCLRVMGEATTISIVNFEGLNFRGLGLPYGTKILRFASQLFV